MSDAFISYSRSDSKAFVMRLRDALEERGKEAWVDLEDIPAASKWEEELREGVAKSDSFVFVISPGSVKSEHCLKELAQAAALNKRTIPLNSAAVDTGALPDPISSHNWIPAQGQFEDHFEDSLDTLVGALDTDLDWVREHTKWGNLASAWDIKGRDGSLLVSGSELEDAEHWLAGQAGKEPAPTDLHRQFVLESRRASTRRGRVILSAVVLALIVSAGLGVFALLQRNEAITQKKSAQQEARVAESQRLALEAQTLAPSQLDLSLLLGYEAHRLDASTATQQGLFSPLTEAAHLQGFDHHFGSDLGTMALDSDRQTLAIGGLDGSIRLWDERTDRALTPAVKAGVGSLLDAAFSPDGRLLAVGGDQATQLFRESTLRPVGPRHTLPGAAEWIAFSPDGQELAASTSKGFLGLWRVPGGQAIAPPMRVSPTRATGLAFNPNGQNLMVGTHEGTAVAVDSATGAEIGEPLRVTSRGETYAVAFSPDGKILATGTETGEILLWDTATGTRRAGPLLFHDSTVYAIGFSPDGKLFASSGDDGNIAIWSTSTGKRVGRPLRGHGELVFDLAFTSSRSLDSVAGGELIRWHLDRISLGRQLDARQGPLAAITLSPDEAEFLTGGTDSGVIKRWTLASMAAAGPPLSTGLRQVAWIQWEPDDLVIVVGSTSGSEDEPRHGRVVLWTLRSNRKIASFSVGKAGITAADLSSDGKALAVGDTAGQVTIFDLDTYKTVAPKLKADNNAVKTVAYSPNGEVIATAGKAGVTTAWRTRDGVQLWTHKTGANVNSLAWNPNGSSLLVSVGLGTLNRLDAATGKPIGSQTNAQVGEPNAVTVDENGGQAAVGGFEGRVAIIRAKSGKVEYAFGGHLGHVNDVLFADGGRVVLSVGDDGRVLARDIDIGLWEREACILADRDLTRDEAETYLKGQDLIKCPEQLLGP